MAYFRDLASVNLDTVEKLDELFHAYISLPHSKMGFAFTVARRIVSLALEEGGSYASYSANFYLRRIVYTCALRTSLVNLLDSWIQKPAGDRFEFFLNLDGERFQTLLASELERLDEEEAKAEVSKLFN